MSEHSVWYRRRIDSNGESIWTCWRHAVTGGLEECLDKQASLTRDNKRMSAVILEVGLRPADDCEE